MNPHKPTAAVNMETIAAVPYIIKMGSLQNDSPSRIAKKKAWKRALFRDKLINPPVSIEKP
ncbi:MAG: hypothetical protein M0T74_16690 [Desulfitobacterium hafniense]|nr:hypothetical protein [Desulfitobacterium hafniense]